MTEKTRITTDFNLSWKFTRSQGGIADAYTIDFDDTAWRDVRLLGVDNGSTRSVQDYQSNRCRTHCGRCLLVLQATDRAGEITVTARAEGLKESICSISVE